MEHNFIGPSVHGFVLYPVRGTVTATGPIPTTRFRSAVFNNFYSTNHVCEQQQ